MLLSYKANGALASLVEEGRYNIQKRLGKRARYSSNEVARTFRDLWM